MPTHSNDDQIVTVEARPDEAGQRIDRWLASKIPHLSRVRVQALIRSGCVRDASLNGSATIGDVGSPVKPAVIYEIRLPEPVEAEAAGEAIPLKVVYEDTDVIVIDKPAGLVVHPAAGHASGTLVNALIAHCGKSLSGIGGERRPGIVHRLDKDTSGLLVVAKNDVAHASLSEQFKSHGRDGRLHRAYLALAWGAPVRSKGVIDAPLSRSTTNRTKISVASGATGRVALTRYEVLESFADKHGAAGVASLLRLELETGRTHQIRVHMAHIGHPILEDAVYGAGFKTRIDRIAIEARKQVESLTRQALHAAELGFEHPRTGKSMTFVSDLPNDMAQALVGFRISTSTPRATEKLRSRRFKRR
ncbi:MAG: RluA family pseudouridine synthase [Hyphomicrobium sp.]